MSRSFVVVLSIVLFTGISLVPALQIGVNGQVQQQQPLQQQNQIALNQVIKQISQQVAFANPDTNATHVYQILVQLAKQTAQTAGNEQAIEEIRQIYSQVITYPYGTVSQSLAHFAQQLASGDNVASIIEQIIQDKSSSTGKNVSQAIVNKAVQTATGANSDNINQVIRQTAQTISNQTGVPVERIESIIIQMALQIAQSHGKAVTGQSIFQIASKIAKNPNGVYAQTLLQLVKQDTGHGSDAHLFQLIRAVVGVSPVSQTELENILEKTPSIDIKPDINAVLNVEPSSVSIEENTPTTVFVSGSLTYINGSGIKDEVISTSIASPGQNTYEYKRKADTDNKGIYEVDFDDVRLPKGTYEIMATPSSGNYSNLSASTQFVVESLPLSFNDIFPYLAASGIIIGIVSYVPRWYIRKRERNNLAQYMIKIYDEYNKFSKSKEVDYLNHFSGLRMELIEILKEGKINEAQYEMLDKKISDYLDRVNKDIYRFTK